MPSTGALSDITILDLTRVLCGPYCTMQLADMGANVIKIETPKGGDDTRAWGPFRNDSSVYFASEQAQHHPEFKGTGGQRAL